MREGVLEVGVERGSDTPVILHSDTKITTATWHYLLINIKLPATITGSVTAIGAMEGSGRGGSIGRVFPGKSGELCLLNGYCVFALFNQLW